MHAHVLGGARVCRTRVACDGLGRHTVSTVSTVSTQSVQVRGWHTLFTRWRDPSSTRTWQKNKRGRRIKRIKAAGHASERVPRSSTQPHSVQSTHTPRIGLTAVSNLVSGFSFPPYSTAPGQVHAPLQEGRLRRGRGSLPLYLARSQPVSAHGLLASRCPPARCAHGALRPRAHVVPSSPRARGVVQPPARVVSSSHPRNTPISHSLLT